MGQTAGFSLVWYAWKTSDQHTLLSSCLLSRTLKVLVRALISRQPWPISHRTSSHLSCCLTHYKALVSGKRPAFCLYIPKESIFFAALYKQQTVPEFSSTYTHLLLETFSHLSSAAGVGLPHTPKAVA